MFCVVQSNAVKDLISIWVHFLRKTVHCKLLTCKNNQYCALNSRKTSLAWLIYQLWKQDCITSNPFARWSWFSNVCINAVKVFVTCPQSASSLPIHILYSVLVMLVQAVPVLSISLEVNQLVPQFKNKTELLETWSKKQNLQSVYRVVCDLEGEIFYVCFTAVEFRPLNTQITPNI